MGERRARRILNGNRGVGVRRKKEVAMVKEDSEGRNISSSEKPKIKAF